MTVGGEALMVISSPLYKLLKIIGKTKFKSYMHRVTCAAPGHARRPAIHAALPNTRTDTTLAPPGLTTPPPLHPRLGRGS